jgi:hypothetical protein
MTNPALKILLALIALALTTDAALAHDLRLARQCRRPVSDRQQRHGHELRCAWQGDQPRIDERESDDDL